MTRIAVIYYSATGNVHALAEAIATGARSASADVRLRRVPELAPDHAIDANPAWRLHVDRTNALVKEAIRDDLAWADGFAFGTPTRFGSVAAQLKQFLDQTGGLWREGKLADKPVTSFTSAHNRHGGQETTILSLNTVFYHWGALIVPPGYTDETIFAAGGNPYGTSWASGSGELPDALSLASARHQGRRLAEVTTKLLAGAPMAAFLAA